MSMQKFYVVGEVWVDKESIVTLAEQGEGDWKVRFCIGTSPIEGEVPFLATNGNPIAVARMNSDEIAEYSALLRAGYENASRELQAYMDAYIF